MSAELPPQPPITGDTEPPVPQPEENLLPTITLEQQEAEAARLEEVREKGPELAEQKRLKDLEDLRNRLREHAEAMHIMAQKANDIEMPASLGEPYQRHAEAMHIKAQIANGIENPTSLEGNQESNEMEKEEAKKEGVLVKPEAAGSAEKVEKKGSKGKEKLSTPQRIARGAAHTGLWAGSIALTGTGIVAAAEIFGAQPLIVSAGATFGIGAGASKIILGGIGGIFVDVMAWQLFKALVLDGGWRSIVNSMNPFGKEKLVADAKGESNRSTPTPRNAGRQGARAGGGRQGGGGNTGH